MCWHLFLHSSRVYPGVVFKRFPSDSETDIIYKLIQMSDMKSLTPTDTEGVAWMKLSVKSDSVQLCPICCDAHRSLWKQHANLDFPFFYERAPLSTFWELLSGWRCGCIFGVLYEDFFFFSNLFEQMSSNVVYLLSLGCAAHLYSWGSYAGVNVIS